MNKSDETRTRPPSELRTIDVNGTRLYIVIQRGDTGRLPLLLINGLGANLESFDPFLEAFANLEGQKIGTIRFDVPGVGRSPLPLFPLRFSGLAYIIATMLDALGQPYVDVLGFSWGGGLAQQFAHQYPQRCRHLVLVATSTGAISIPGRPDALAKLLSPHGYFQPSYLASIAPALYGGRFRSDPELVRIYTELARAPGSLGYYWQLLASAGWTSIPWIRCLRQPTLILAGDDDPVVPPINARIMARLIPNATLHIINGGHLFLLTEAQEVAPLVHQFLTGDTFMTKSRG
jgi:poly(3-hydroxyoctanoate) depolymerase